MATSVCKDVFLGLDRVEGMLAPAREVGVAWVSVLVPFWDSASARAGMGSLVCGGVGCHRSRVLSRLVWGVGDCGERGESASRPSSPGRDGGVEPGAGRPFLDGCRFWSGVSRGPCRTASAGMEMDLSTGLAVGLLEDLGISSALVRRSPSVPAGLLVLLGGL